MHGQEVTRSDENLQKLEHRTVGSLRKLQSDLSMQTNVSHADRF